MSLLRHLLTIATLAVAYPAAGQGLLSLQNQLDRKEAEQPFSYVLSAGGGYDRLDYKASDAADIDSLFIQGGVGAMFSDLDRTTPWNLGLELGSLYYFDAPPTIDEANYSTKAVFNIAHEFSPRLRVNNNFYLTYEIEPNFGVGASTARRNGQYWYGYNNFSVAYAWSERFSTTSSYTVDGIKYEDGEIGQFEDRFSHLFSQQFSYALDRTMKAVMEYRFRTTRYDRATSANFTSHYLLAGVDKAWSERSSASFRAGAEYQDSERSQNTAPYFEAAISHAASQKTSVQMVAAFGYDGSELGNFDSRYSYRAGANASHQVSDRLRLNGGVNYIYSDFDGDNSITEHQVNATAGVGYRVWENISLDANYTYTLLTSEDEFRDYDRNRIYLGLNASF
jgi:hypothetical protein